MSEGALKAGGLAGGIFAAVRGDRLQVKTSSSCLLGAALTLFPLGLSLWLSLPPMVCYGVLLASSFLAMGLATVFSVQMLAYIQMETPAQLTGKVLSWVLTFSLCAQPLGLAFYGTVFEFCATMPYLPLFGAAVAALLLAGAARNVFGRL